MKFGEVGITEISDIPGPPPIAAAPTSIALFIGWAPSGPTDRALPLFGFADYQREFGGLDARSWLGYAVRHFYDNGGGRAWVLRIASADGDALAHADPGFIEALNAAFAAGGPVDLIAAFNLLCVPGLTNAAAMAMLQAQARARRAFLIADCEESAGTDTIPATSVDDDASHSALYFPWVRAPDPLRGGAPRAFPPSGFVAGAFARTDSRRAVWKAPAGIEVNLAGAIDITVHLSDSQADVLTAQGINCLRKFPSAGLVVWGARTLAGRDTENSEWKYVPVRRTALFIQQSIQNGTKWAAFEPNAEPLWSRLRAIVTDFMSGLFRQGAFAGNTAAKAFFVRCGRDTTTQNEIDNGIVNVVVGFAPLKSAEFAVVTVAQLAGRE